MTDSERILTEALARWTQQNVTRLALRTLFDLAQGPATEMLHERNVRFAEDLLTNPAQAELFLDQAKARKVMPPQEVARQMTEATADSARVALRAASLIFVHAMLDSMALDCCRAATWVAPKDCLKFVESRKVDLKAALGESADSILGRQLEQFLNQMDHESLLEKVDYIYSRCKPEAGFAGVGGGYKFDRDKLEHLDQQRHETVHGKGIRAAEKYSDEDDEYLTQTALHLMALVARSFGMKFDVEFLREKMAEHDRK
ncbi:MAG: hypothetical protein ABL977_02720 [Candidatus Eisenbacteria bacterium]